jgi:hypothetical protein
MKRENSKNSGRAIECKSGKKYYKKEGKGKRSVNEIKL